MTAITTLRPLPPGYEWRRKINAQPRTTHWIAVPSTEQHTVSAEVSTPKPGDIVRVDDETLLFLGEAPEVTRTRAMLTKAGLIGPWEALDVAVGRLIKQPKGTLSD
jgi:hypothetical protein